MTSPRLEGICGLRAVALGLTAGFGDPFTEPFGEYRAIAGHVGAISGYPS